MGWPYPRRFHVCTNGCEKTQDGCLAKSCCFSGLRRWQASSLTATSTPWPRSSLACNHFPSPPVLPVFGGFAIPFVLSPVLVVVRLCILRGFSVRCPRHPDNMVGVCCCAGAVVGPSCLRDQFKVPCALGFVHRLALPLASCWPLLLLLRTAHSRDDDRHYSEAAMCRYACCLRCVCFACLHAVFMLGIFEGVDRRHGPRFPVQTTGLPHGALNPLLRCIGRIPEWFPACNVGCHLANVCSAPGTLFVCGLFGRPSWTPWVVEF